MKICLRSGEEEKTARSVVMKWDFTRFQMSDAFTNLQREHQVHGILSRACEPM
jgi:hypothetical protein